MNLPRLPPHQNAFPKPSPLGVNYRSGFGAGGPASDGGQDLPVEA